MRSGAHELFRITFMKTKTGGLMALLAVGLAGGVQAQEAEGERSGFFVSGGLGINFLEDLEIPVGGPVGTATWKFDPGSRLTAGVGYQLYQNSAISIAIAAETGFLYNTLDEVTAGGLGTADADGDFTQVPFLGKVVLKFMRSEEHTSELQSRLHLVCRLLLEKKK